MAFRPKAMPPQRSDKGRRQVSHASANDLNRVHPQNPWLHSKTRLIGTRFPGLPLLQPGELQHRQGDQLTDAVSAQWNVNNMVISLETRGFAVIDLGTSLAPLQATGDEACAGDGVGSSGAVATTATAAGGGGAAADKSKGAIAAKKKSEKKGKAACQKATKASAATSAANNAVSIGVREDDAAKKRRQKKEKAARQKAAKAAGAGAGARASRLSTGRVHPGGTQVTCMATHPPMRYGQKCKGVLVEKGSAAHDASKAEQPNPTACATCGVAFTSGVVLTCSYCKHRFGKCCEDENQMAAAPVSEDADDDGDNDDKDEAWICRNCDLCYFTTASTSNQNCYCCGPKRGPTTPFLKGTTWTHKDNYPTEPHEYRCRRCRESCLRSERMWICSNGAVCGNPYNADRDMDHTNGDTPPEDALCTACFADFEKFADVRPTAGASSVHGAAEIIKVHFALPQAQKSVFRSSKRDEGYSRSAKLGKETFSWSCAGGPGLDSNHLGQGFNALGWVSSTLIHVGADIVSCALKEALNIPEIHFSRGFGAGFGMGASVDHGATIANEEVLAAYDLWMTQGLVCPRTSRVQAFKYLAPGGLAGTPSAASIQCEEHVDRGLVTIVLNPHGLELYDQETSEWIKAESLVSSPTQAIVFAGVTLERASNRAFRAAVHRVNGDHERLSVVIKVRANMDTALDVAWATQAAAEEIRTDAVAKVLVSELMVELHRTHGSVNIQPRSEVIADDHEARLNARGGGVMLSIATPQHGEAGNFSILPGDTIALILAGLDAEALGRLACVNKWFNATATRDLLWLKLCRTANLDWTEFHRSPSESAESNRSNNQLYQLVGPRLVEYGRNRTITLFITFNQELNNDIGKPGAHTTFEAAATVSSDFSTWQSQSDDYDQKANPTFKVTIDQRTPLNTVVDHAVALMSEGKKYPRGWVCFIGKQQNDMFDSGYDEAGRHHVDTALAAWNYHLESGDLLTMHEKALLTD